MSSHIHSKKVRKDKDLTQAELANRLGVSDRAISKWENGRGLPDYEYIQDLCDDLNITPCDDKVGLERKHKSFEYSLWGILDIQNGVLKSVIDFEIDENEIFDYGYLDGKYVKIDVLRLDFEF